MNIAMTSPSSDPFYRNKSQTYRGFVRLAFWSLLHVVAILILMAIFLL